MNLSFYLLPKSEVAYVNRTDTVDKAIKVIRKSGFQSVPVINAKGEYVSVISAGDFLMNLTEDYHCDLELMKRLKVESMRIKRPYHAVSIDEDISEVYEYIVSQNFIPVVDGRDVFIGIITRREILQALLKMKKEYEHHLKLEHNKNVFELTPEMEEIIANLGDDDSDD